MAFPRAGIASSSRRLLLGTVVAAIALACVGCAGAPRSVAQFKGEFPADEAAGAGPTAAAAEPQPSLQMPDGGSPAASDAAVLASQPARTSRTAGRRIIYTAQLQLVTEDLSGLEERLRQLIQREGGYLSNTAVSGRAGQFREGEWTVRIPVARYDAFLAAAVKLGELQSLHSSSQDVTEEFVDLEARLKSKRLEETRLQEHL
ncbi:MAG: DUF4349 domain-containing protein [Armatimonadetes bacterium]|nr:DUF4349 domain-containing protein [Armatimonadota bacterium]